MDPMMALMQNNLPETVDDMRSMLDRFAAMLNAGLPEVGAFHEKVAIDACDAAVTADIVVPKGEGPFPVLVYLHGGGWICGSPTTHRKLAHRFAEAGYLVFNVDYRMAPEHPFPTPVEDCVEAVRWVAREAARWGGDASRLAVGGDSAGGNLSAATAVALADDPAVDLKAALLIYGVFDFANMDAAGDSPDVPAEMLEAVPKLMELMVGSYLGSERPEALLADPRVSPIHSASALPPSHIVCGAMDPLADQARALAETLANADVAHELFIEDGMPHGFAQMEFFPQAQQSIDRMCAFLRKQLG
jgi:acetyl esterase